MPHKGRISGKPLKNSIRVKLIELITAHPGISNKRLAIALYGEDNHLNRRCIATHLAYILNTGIIARAGMQLVREPVTLYRFAPLEVE